MKQKKRPILKIKNEQNLPEDFRETFAGASDKTIAKILRILNKHDIAPGDPSFLMFGAITHTQLALEPIPDHLEDLKEEIKAVLYALREQVEVSFKRHEDLNHDFYVTAERLSAILNQKLFEIDHYEQRRQNTLIYPLKNGFAMVPYHLSYWRACWRTCNLNTHDSICCSVKSTNSLEGFSRGQSLFLALPYSSSFHSNLT